MWDDEASSLGSEVQFLILFLILLLLLLRPQRCNVSINDRTKPWFETSIRIKLITMNRKRKILQIHPWIMELTFGIRPEIGWRKKNWFSRFSFSFILCQCHLIIVWITLLCRYAARRIHDLTWQHMCTNYTAWCKTSYWPASGEKKVYKFLLHVSLNVNLKFNVYFDLKFHRNLAWIDTFNLTSVLPRFWPKIYS